MIHNAVMRRLTPKSFSALTLLACLTVGSEAEASWPMCRHDAQRTGATSGSSNVTSPIAYWRTYLGGSLGSAQLATADLQGTGKVSLLLASTGAVAALDASGQALWRSKLLGIGSIAGVADVDGDGNVDVVAASGDHVYIFSTTGTIEWAEPDGQMGTLSGVRLGDVNGDGLPDVIIQECGCCGVTSGNPGVAYSFAGGFASPNLLGSLPFPTCGSKSLTVVNATGAAPLDILVADYTHFALVGGAGLNVLASTAALGTWVDESDCYTANLDGMPGDEVICFENTSLAPSTNQRTVTVLHYTAQPPSLSVVWSKVVAPDSGGDMSWLDPVEDLDGDGTFELVYATNDPTNGWQTHVADALTGADLVSPLVGQTPAGSATLQAATIREVLTQTPTTTTAWSFTRSPTPTLNMLWTESGSIMTYPLPAKAQLQYDPTGPLATDLNGDGLPDLVLQQVAPNDGIVAFSGAGGMATQLGALNLQIGVDPLRAWVVPGLTTMAPQIAFARTDGILNLLDGHLALTDTSGIPVAIPFGGYYGTGAWRELFHGPRVGALDSSGHDAIVVDDSRDALLRLDASTASLAAPPTVVWEATHTFGATLVPGLVNGATGVQALSTVQPVTSPPTYKATVLGPNGVAEWAQLLTGNPLNDPVAADFNGDGVPDLALQVSAGNSNLSTLALSGANGSLLWTPQTMNPGGGGTQSDGLSLSDWNGDGVSDIFFQGSGTFVLSGSTGTQLTAGGPVDLYAMPVLYDTNGDGVDEITLNGGEFPVQIYSHDLTTALWTSSENDLPYPYGAIVQCPGTPPVPTLVEGSWKNPARLKITPLNGSSLGAFTTIVLAGGSLYPNEAAAKAAGAYLGQLTSTNAHSNLTGHNRPTAVVGSSDGWLYGVNPCGGALDFAVSFGAPVGEAAFGDTDGDGKDEIIVSAADGYLYDLKNEAIAAPAYVWDTDPPAFPNTQVNTVVTTNQLSAVWASVSGATSYEVQVVTPSGSLISTPSWQSVGNATSTTLHGLPLKNATKYLFAVRAIGQNGSSVDAISPGVTVYFPDGGAGTDGGNEGGADASRDAPADVATDVGVDARSDAAGDASEDGSAAPGGSGGGGCGCVAAGASAATAWGALVPAVVLIVRRRRSRASA